jgi:hypothetical protein
MVIPDGKIPFELQRLIDAELSSGERVTWSAQPIPGRFAGKGLGIVLFGIPWTAFALFWTGAAAWGTWRKGGLGWIRLFPMFGLPFILLGVGMLSSPYWMRRQAGRTVYVLTSRRAIILSGGRRGSATVRSFEPERLTDITRRQNPDGSGDVVFARDIRRDGDGDRLSTDVGFLAVRDVKSVEQKVRTLAALKRDEAV